MKQTALLFLAITAIALTTGCSTTPTAFDRAVANVQTNSVPTLGLKTNVVTITETNVVVQTITNSVGVPVFVTNATTIVTLQTNLLVVTNMVPGYTLTPNATSTATAGVAGAVANLAAPGVGELATGSLLAALSIFLGWRNRQMNGKNDALSQSAGVLAQIIETGRELMAKTPQGQQAANAFTQWMVTHQAETDTIGQITQIVKDSTNNTEAQAAATQIQALIAQTPPPPKV